MTNAAMMQRGQRGIERYTKRIRRGREVENVAQNDDAAHTETAQGYSKRVKKQPPHMYEP